MPITTLCVACWTKHVCMYETHLLFQPSLKIMRHSKNGTYRSFIHTKLNTKRVPLFSFSSYNFFSMHNFRVGGGLTLQFQLGSNLKPTALSGIYSTILIQKKNDNYQTQHFLLLQVIPISWEFIAKILLTVENYLQEMLYMQGPH